MATYYERHKKEIIARVKAWKKANPSRVKASRRRHQPHYAAYHRLRRVRLRFAAITMLGSECRRCSYEDVRALQFNHINGDGGSREIYSGGGQQFYLSILRGRPDVELLCANCNVIYEYERGTRFAPSEIG